MENPDVVLEMAIENEIVDRNGRKTDKLVFSYKNYSREKDLGKSAMEFGTIMCSMMSNAGLEDEGEE